MVRVNIQQAKSQLSRLLVLVEQGEDVLIARAGKPVARLVLASEAAMPRMPGSARGLFDMPDDFDASLPDELLAGFES